MVNPLFPEQLSPCRPVILYSPVSSVLHSGVLGACYTPVLETCRDFPWCSAGRVTELGANQRTSRKTMCGVAPGSRQGSSGGSGNNANLQAVACGRQLYCTRLTCFTLNLSLAAFCSHTVGPYLVSQVTSIERHFGLSSTQVGALISANDIGFLVTVLAVSHFGKHAHIPRLLCAAYIIFGLSSALIAATYFISPVNSETTGVGNGTGSHAINNSDWCVTANEAVARQLCQAAPGQEVGSNLLVVVLMGMMLSLQGVTKATRGPLGTTYIDNNVPARSQTAMYLGMLMTFVLFGPAAGFVLGAICGNLPVDLKQTDLKTSDPRWVGAWWLGFLVAGLIAMATAIPLVCFPRRMIRGRGEDCGQQPAEDDDKNCGGDCSVHTAQQDAVPTSAADDRSASPHSDAARVVCSEKSKDYACGENNKISMATTGVKHKASPLKVERRGFQAMAKGLTSLVLGGVGTYAGGLMASRMKLTRRRSLRFVLALDSVSIILTIITIVLGCDNQPMTGLGMSEVRFDDGLNVCYCDSQVFSPVCDGEQTFVSPCHAACNASDSFSKTYVGCMLARNQTVTVGMCSYTCHLMIPFIVTQALAIGLSSACVTPIYVTVLRSVAEADKTLALGLLAFVISLVGIVPAPIVFGAVIDATCRLWKKECGRAGSCDVYDVTTLRRRYIGLQVGASLLGNALLAAALLILTWQVRTHRTEDTVDDGISDSVRKAKKDDGDDVTDVEMTQL
ncbi:solute carrier organic anion transporter family member 3A1-like isoform X2 [Pomacea canaliculata]|uniref:solute carrier organic anion transporter family member 3A1-like isoform X2 n=1 Tax=Pomacea canaliculata TaxID=400727 RepID=UPI000D73A672|nr:solute carrier organic anion transporter family member 3A1-like isoform X2 [Pomacea canaliculata]